MKNGIPRSRSSKTITNAIAIYCVAVSAMIEVANMPHTKIGIRKRLIPGARIVKIVVSILMEPSIDDKPTRKTPNKKNCIPNSAFTLRGG